MTDELVGQGEPKWNHFIFVLHVLLSSCGLAWDVSGDPRFPKNYKERSVHSSAQALLNLLLCHMANVSHMTKSRLVNREMNFTLVRLCSSRTPAGVRRIWANFAI